MVKAPPNHNSLKDYSLQQDNNVDNRRLSVSCTDSLKQRRNNKEAGSRANSKIMERVTDDKGRTFTKQVDIMNVQRDFFLICIKSR